jgi:ribonuclease D
MALETFQICDRDLTPELRDLYLGAPAIAVDTETMGLNHLRDRLCLVQLCSPSGEASAVRIEPGQTEAPNLKLVLESTAVVKIFHFARFDVATIKHHLDIQVNPIFCTKVASKLARTYTSKHGLKELVQELTQVELDKSAQCSDWGNAANLTSGQLSYAANDVRYLYPVHMRLIEMLQRENRWDLAQQCFQCIPTMAMLDLMQFDHLFDH